MTRNETERPLGLATSEAIYRRLLALLPAGLRDAHREDAVLLFRDLYRDAARRGGLSVAALWCRSAVRLLGCALDEARRSRSEVTRLRPRRRPGSRFDLLAQDLRFALRSFARRPGFTLTALATLALGIGATTTIFSVVDGAVLRPLPYPDPDRLVFIDDPSHPVPDFVAWQERTRSFATLAAVWDFPVDLLGEGPPAQVGGALVTSQFLETFGARARLGRLLGEEDFRNTAHVAVIGDGLWQRRWGGDPSIVGRTVDVGGEAFEIVGVLDPSFEVPEVVASPQTEIWSPLDVHQPSLQHRGLYILSVVGRLQPDVTLAAARAEMDSVSRALAEEFERNRLPDGSPRIFVPISLQEAVVGSFGKTGWTLLGAVGLLLVLACANVANLFLARGSDRRSEIVLRNALGAGRPRIVMQLLTESVLLALVAGGLGVGVAFGGVKICRVLAQGIVPRLADLTVDVRILAFAVALSAVTGLVFGIVPAWLASRADMTSTFRTFGAARGNDRLRSALVVAEIALALVLAIGGGLLIHSFVRLGKVELGFRSEDLVTVPLRLRGRDAEQRRVLVDELLARLRALSGVEAAAAGITVPMEFHGDSRCCWRGEVVPLPRGSGKEVVAFVHPVTPGYLSALGATLRSGRELLDSDQGGAPGAVLDETLARRLYGGDDPVGQSVEFGDWTFQVVGVVEDIREWGPEAGGGEAIYIPYAGYGDGFDRVHLALRTRLPADVLAGGLRRSIWEVDPTLPVEDVASMRQRYAGAVSRPFFYTVLLAVFAGVSGILAVIGIYSSMLYSVTRRKQELGVRLALGARASDIRRLVLRRASWLTALGLALGLAGALAGSRLIESLVFDIAPTDPLTFALVALAVALVALAASYLPARRAGRTDPLDALRTSS